MRRQIISRRIMSDFWARVLEHVRDGWRSSREHGFWAPVRFRLDRWGSNYQRAYQEPLPLVSICVPTYNRAELLMSRCVRSLLAQTYANLEIIIIGDGCTDDTSERMTALDDPRLVFFNLPERGKYPEETEARWRVAGSAATDYAYSIAKGMFVTRLDDDDEHAPDRVEKLVAFAKQTRADLIFHPFHQQQPDGSWWLNPAPWLRLGSVTSGSIFFHRWLTRVAIHPASIRRYREPGDWHRIRQMRYLGARIRRYPEPLLRHYRERNQSEYQVPREETSTSTG